MIMKIPRNGKTDVYLVGAPRGLKANMREGSSSMTSKPPVEVAGTLKRFNDCYLAWFHQVPRS